MATTRPEDALVRPVLIAADYSDPASLALTQGFALANALGTTPHVVYVATPRGSMFRIDAPDKEYVLSSEEARVHLAERVQQQLEYYQQRYGAVNFDVAVSHVRAGNAGQEIVQLAADVEAQLIVIGTHGRSGVKRLVLGSVAEAVTRNAPCPVLVARPVKVSDDTPSIEPPCPRCLDVRRSSGGRELWCEEHKRHFWERHTYHHVTKNVRSQENAPLVYPMGGARL